MTNDLKKKYLKEKSSYNLDDLLLIMEILRSPDGCPWDAEQTHKSIRNDIIEETYEVIEAIDNSDMTLMCEELGDVLLQVVFHSQIAKEEKAFCIDDVLNGICTKLISRHPHVFSEMHIDTSEQVLSNWEKIKSDEKKRISVSDKLKAIPQMLPALMRAQKVGKKAKCFDFENVDEVLKKLDEERDEVFKAIENGSKEEIREEIGDLLLTITSVCRKLDIDAEQALNASTDKFIARFEQLEFSVSSENKSIEEQKMGCLNEKWEKIKQK